MLRRLLRVVSFSLLPHITLRPCFVRGPRRLTYTLIFVVRKTVAKKLTNQPLSAARRVVVEAKYEIHKGRGRGGGRGDSNGRNGIRHMLANRERSSTSSVR